MGLRLNGNATLDVEGSAALGDGLAVRSFAGRGETAASESTSPSSGEDGAGLLEGLPSGVVDAARLGGVGTIDRRQRWLSWVRVSGSKQYSCPVKSGRRN